MVTRSLHRSQVPLLNLSRAHAMRACPTDSEAALWRELRSKKLGAAFKRQVCVGRRIVDFLAPAEKVIVEVDGPYHARRRTADARRERELTRAGYRVVRVSEEAVRRDLPQVLAQIRAALESRS